jgi:two-component system, NtrC family, response regulator HydG
VGESRPVTPIGRVLLVDDDRVFGTWATKVLQARDFHIQHVLDPVTALRLIETEPWDLVITDVEMPRMNGLEFLDRARRLVPGLPVVVVTSHPTVDRALRALRQPATDFIQKPVTAPDFAARVAALIAQPGRAPADTPESVLAIGAHPGDVEIGAGGALLAHEAAGVAVTILTLSRAAPDGTGWDSEGTSGDVTQAIGTRVDLADLAATGGGEGDATSAALAGLVAQTQPTVLYTHSIHDSQPEHRAAHLAAVAAARRIGRVFCFQSPSATLDFRPAHFVLIDDHLTAKLAAVRAYISQAEVRDFLEPDQITSTARYWARYCQAHPAEAFEVVRDRAATGVAPGERGAVGAAS